MIVHLSAAQISALECGGLDWDAPEPGPIERAWSTHRHALVFEEADRDALADALNEMSNAEDAFAEERTNDREMRTFARRASRSLAALYGRVLRAERGAGQ